MKSGRSRGARGPAPKWFKWPRWQKGAGLALLGLGACAAPAPSPRSSSGEPEALARGLGADRVVPRPRTARDLGGEPIALGRLRSDESLRPAAEAFARGLERLGARVEAVAPSNAGAEPDSITFVRDEAFEGEAHRIDVRGDGLFVRAGTIAGAARGAATLLQLVSIDGGIAHAPRIEIDDAPDLGFRGFMVDMGRNPHSPRTLRATVDMLWLVKANVLHLHLADDQLSSWPSEAFPRIASPEAGWTRDDFVELERYASARGITLVPELDVPGHSTILRREYPGVFGTTPTELATWPASGAGLITLIDEMLAVFRSTSWVHIGGDEAYGVPEEAQRDLIRDLSAHLRARGKRAIVWEGPGLGTGENKVDEDVIHMNWRGVEFPAQAMLDAGYEVINASWNPLYIVDHYPRTMFTAVDVERCYGFDPRVFAHVNPAIDTFAEPHRTRSADGILGFCMPWWEGREENLFGLAFPRLSAVAAAAWNRAGESDVRDFLRRQSSVRELFERVTGVTLPRTPYAPSESQAANLAFRGRVTASSGSVQPPFGPERLTNGIPDPFDHFLGFPTRPDPLVIRIELPRAAIVGRVRVHERAVGASHEVYRLSVSVDGESFERIGESVEGTRGERRFVDHVFTPREVRFLEIETDGCHGLTFPSFSRLSEVMAFAE